MYIPAAFGEDRPEVLHTFIREHPLATIVTCGADGLEATHAPVVFHSQDGQNGRLQCHIARANSQWKALQQPFPVLVIFQGPEHYITPSWYPAKQEHGKVVPTWNYAAVHVRGEGTYFEESLQLLNHVKELTAQQEASFPKPWAVEDAPREFIEALTRAIIGIDIRIDSIEGKWKMSQNRPEADREGAITGLRALDTQESRTVAEMIKAKLRR